MLVSQDKSQLSVGRKDKQVKIMGKFNFSNRRSFLYFMYYFFVADELLLLCCCLKSV